MLKAGKLRHRVVIQKPIETQNTNSGDMNVVWQDVATVWCSIEPISAKEFISAQNENTEVNTRIIIRYRSDISHEMRLYHATKNKFYNIEGLLSDKESGLEYITMPCSEGTRYISPVAESVPVNLEIPEISGTPSSGSTLTSNQGLWANDPSSYQYQWYLNDLEVEGAVSSSWIVSGLFNDIVTVGVKSTNTAGQSTEAFSEGLIIE